MHVHVLQFTSVINLLFKPHSVIQAILYVKICAIFLAQDSYVTYVLYMIVFRYDFASNRWLKEATTRRKIPNTESCGFIPMNGELYVLRSAKVRVEASGPWRQLKKKLAMEFQVYNPVTKKWRVLTTHPPVDAPIDFRTAALCTVEL